MATKKAIALNLSDSAGLSMNGPVQNIQKTPAHILPCRIRHSNFDHVQSSKLRVIERVNLRSRTRGHARRDAECAVLQDARRNANRTLPGRSTNHVVPRHDMQ